MPLVRRGTPAWQNLAARYRLFVCHILVRMVDDNGATIIQN
jgi:hypothetical protein